MTSKKRVTFDVLIEIPKGSRNKYEYDFVLNKIRFDRTLFSSMMYPGDYGFVPETLALDKDPLETTPVQNEKIAKELRSSLMKHFQEAGQVPWQKPE